MSIGGPKEFRENSLFASWNVAIKGFREEPVNLFAVTVMGWKVDPAGTITLIEVEVASVTVAFAAPKYTTFRALSGLKFAPLIITVAPTGPVAGLNELIVGT